MDSLSIQLLTDTARVPQRQREGDLGYDLYADQDAVIEAGQVQLLRTGVALALPPGVAGLVIPRSGNALKLALSVNNSPGLIDAGYRGDVSVIAINHGAEPVRVEQGMRIAQLLLVPALTPQLQIVDRLPDPQDGRGTAGFGSSGS
jgi:dUTP pyrophosphatase